jgi:hypothetical protein
VREVLATHPATRPTVYYGRGSDGLESGLPARSIPKSSSSAAAATWPPAPVPVARPRVVRTTAGLGRT